MTLLDKLLGLVFRQPPPPPPCDVPSRAPEIRLLQDRQTQIRRQMLQMEADVQLRRYEHRQA